jgi:hypothetical protein
MSRVRIVLLSVLCVAAAAVPASASLIFDATIPVSGVGFGNIPRDLTIQGNPNKTTESGCVSITSGGAIAFTCRGTDASNDPNGVIPVGGDDPPPLADNQKYGIPTAASLGITQASQIQIIADFTEPNGNSANVTDLTLKFYRTFNGVTTFVGSIDGQQNFPSTIPGNGQAGFGFKVSPDEYAYVNGLLGLGNISFALESTITNVAGGPESYFIRNGSASTVPEPASIALLGSGLFGVVQAARRRRRS